MRTRPPPTASSTPAPTGMPTSICSPAPATRRSAATPRNEGTPAPQMRHRTACARAIARRVPAMTVMRAHRLRTQSVPAPQHTSDMSSKPPPLIRTGVEEISSPDALDGLSPPRTSSSDGLRIGLSRRSGREKYAYARHGLRPALAKACPPQASSAADPRPFSDPLRRRCAPPARK